MPKTTPVTSDATATAAQLLARSKADRAVQVEKERARGQRDGGRS
ncbi:hypothetical protein ACFY7V_03695 [[Kitasatospora] papulosa]